MNFMGLPTLCTLSAAVTKIKMASIQEREPSVFCSITKEMLKTHGTKKKKRVSCRCSPKTNGACVQVQE